MVKTSDCFNMMVKHNGKWIKLSKEEIDEKFPEIPEDAYNDPHNSYTSKTQSPTLYAHTHICGKKSKTSLFNWMPFYALYILYRGKHL